jgi:hypothetical protein
VIYSALLIKYFAGFFTRVYHCNMNTPGKITTTQEVSVNGLRYTYTIQPFEATNALGAITAILTEYKLSGSAGDTISLYKTKEGNWYEIKQSDSPLKNALMTSLKSAIDKLETGQDNQ